MNIQGFSNEARQVISLGRQRHWRFRVLDDAGMIATPEFKGDWLYLPVDQDNYIIPKRALNRVQFIEDAGFKPKGLIIAHEATNLLSAPPKVPKNVEFPSEKVESAFTSALNLLLILGKALGYMVLMSALAVDPALIVVLPDGTWIEVMRWYE